MNIATKILYFFVLRYLAPSAVIMALFAPSIFVIMTPQKTEAAFGFGDTVIEVGANLWTNVANTVEAIWSTLKESTLDGIGWLLAKIIIQGMTIEIINWINRDFEGYPGFVNNLGVFLTDIADQATGAFIRENNLEYLCNPLSIRIALLTYQYEPIQQRYACTLSGVVSNVESFIQGNFAEGGWTGWFSHATIPTNNLPGQYLTIQGELIKYANKKEENQKNYLSFGQGMFSDLSFEWCQTVANDEGVPDGNGGIHYEEGMTRDDCPIKTPGKLITDQLTWTTTSPLRQAELADEINEAIGAILSTLMSKLLRDGLAYLSGEGLGRGTPGSSYSDLLREDVARQQLEVKGDILLQIDQQIEEELALGRELGCYGEDPAEGDPGDGTGAGEVPDIVDNEIRDVPIGDRAELPEDTTVGSIGYTPADAYTAYQASGQEPLSRDEFNQQLVQAGLIDSPTSTTWSENYTLSELGIDESSIIIERQGTNAYRVLYDADGDGQREVIATSREVDGQPGRYTFTNVTPNDLGLTNNVQGQVAAGAVNESLRNLYSIDENETKLDPVGTGADTGGQAR